MRREHWQKIEEIFNVAVEYHGRERDEYLRRACKDDQRTLLEIAELLKEHESPSPSLENSVLDIGLQMLEERELGGRTGESIGHLRIGNLIGRGGMGEIYAAEDTQIGRPVAIKLVNGLFALDAERIRRFQKEAEAASRVSHPNVAKLFELCEIDGEHLIVMELVDGVNLRQHLIERLAPGKALDITIQVASALTAAHAAGVVHRDIKPENIIITPGGSIKVLDFGLAKLVEPIGEGAMRIAGGENAKLTVDMSTEFGALVGTPAYMSPEQIRGANVGTQTDIWSLGVLLYEMLTGQLPFRGSTKIDLIAAVLTSEPAPVLKIRKNGIEGINAVIRKALAKNQEHRYPTAEQFLDDLQTLRDNEQREKGPYSWKTISLLLPALKYAVGAVLIATLLIGVIPASRQKIARYFFVSHDGLIGYWPANGTVNDVAGGNDAILRGNSAFAPGYIDQAFMNDGVNGYIEIPDSRSVSFTGPFTLEARIKINNNSTQQAIIEKYDEGGFDGYLMRIVDGRVVSAVLGASWPASQAVGATNVTTGVWHKVTAVYDGRSIKIYLDGVLDGIAATTVKPTDGEGSVKIGARGDDADTRFDGLIDEVKMYNRALSPGEIVPAGGLVSYWPADGNAYDVVGGNSGELLNGATYRPGVSGQAFSFDGLDDLMQAPTAGLPTGSSDRSVAMWIIIDEFQTLELLFSNYGTLADDQSYILGASASERLPYISNYGGGATGTQPLEPGRWYYIAATSTATSTDQSSVSLYLDGALAKTGVMRIDTPADTLFFCGTIPGKAGRFRKLKGAIDEIAVFDRALSAGEINALFSARRPENEPANVGTGTDPAVASSGLVGHWPGDGNATDTVGGSNGILYDGVEFVPGNTGMAFGLDGVNGYIEIPDSPALSITGPLTLEARIKVTKNNIQQAIIEKYDEPGINGYFLRMNSAGKIEAGVCNSVSCGWEVATGATIISTGRWHRVAAVYDGKTVKVYLDGKLDADFPTNFFPTDGAESLKIGARGDDAGTPLGGLIDEIKIYDRALSSAEMMLKSGLVSYWPADGNPNDVVGNNKGQMFGGAAYRPGVSGQAFSFDNADAFFQAPTGDLPIGNSDRTMTMWVTIDDVLTPTAFFGGYGRFGSTSQTYLLTTVVGQYLSITNWGEGPGLTKLEPRTWYFIAATTDRYSTSLYVNGKLVKKQKMTLDTPPDTQFYSGRMPGELGDIRRLIGAVDEIQIFDRALSPAEIQTLYLANKPPEG